MPDSLRPASPYVTPIELRTSPYFQIALYAGGNVLAVLCCLLLWWSVSILSAFQEPLLWAWLCSLSLRDLKRYLVTTARKELQSSSFLVCCAKLVFLPAVILWQLIEEVRDKLQSKFHELQQKTQGPDGSQQTPAAATATVAAPTATTAAGQFSRQPTAAPLGHQSQDIGSTAAAAATSSDTAGAAATNEALCKLVLQQKPQQQLRQRKPAAVGLGAAGSHQQQQVHKRRKPPLGPKPSLQVSSTASNSTATSTDAGGTARKGSKQQPHAAGTAAANSRSKAADNTGSSDWQRRLDSYKHVALRQLRWWWFCIVELIKFLLGGLLPKRQQPQLQSSVRPQNQQMAHLQQHQQQLSSAASSRLASRTNGTAYAAAAGWPASISMLEAGAPVRASLTGSFGSACLPETVLPPQLYQQHLLQQVRGLTMSHSSPNLQMLDLHLADDQVASSHPAAYGVIAAAGSVGTMLAADDSQCHNGGDLLPPSFGGWTGFLHGLQSPVRQQQQQQQQHQHSEQQQDFSRANSNSSNGGSINSYNCGTQLSTAPSIPAPQAAQSLHPIPLASAAASPAVSRISQSSTSPLRLASLPATDPVPLDIYFGLGPTIPVTTGSGRLSSSASAAPGFTTYRVSSGTYDGSDIAGAAGWDPSCSFQGDVGSMATKPNSVVGSGGAALGSGSDSSAPSSILFKWLLRGIILQEMYRLAQAWASDQPVFVLLLLLGGTLAIAGGLPFLLLPRHLWRSSLQESADRAPSLVQPNSGQVQQKGLVSGIAGSVVTGKAKAKSRKKGLQSPFEEQQPLSKAERRQEGAYQAVGWTAAWQCFARLIVSKTTSSKIGGSSSRNGIWSCLSGYGTAVWMQLLQLLARTDGALRDFWSSSFLDAAVSGLIVVGLILGTVVLSVVLLVQVGDESRQAVVHLNTLVRQTSNKAALHQGVWSLLQEYEGQVTNLLKDSLPQLTQYVESRATDFLITHNLSRVLLDVESVKTALHLPGDCGQEAKIRLAVQVANSSLAVQALTAKRDALQQQLNVEQQLLERLAADWEALWLQHAGQSSDMANAGVQRVPNSTMAAGAGLAGSRNGARKSGSSSSNSSSSIAAQLLLSQRRLEVLQDKLRGVAAQQEAATEQLQLAELRLHNCQPPDTAAAKAAAGSAQAVFNPLASFIGYITSWGFAGHGSTAVQDNPVVPPGHLITPHISHFRPMLYALAHLDFATASKEAAAIVGQLFTHHAEQQQQQQDAECAEQQEKHEPLASPLPININASQVCRYNDSCSRISASAIGQDGVEQPACYSVSTIGSEGCPASSKGNSSNASNSSSSSVTSRVSSGTTASSSPTAAGPSIMRVAQGAAYPLIRSLRNLSSVFLTGIGSTTAVALGTGLGVLRLGLGVVKFLVQLGVFASVLYTVLALDIDPVEQLLRLLPLSEASQDRASRAVTKAMRGVFVSSLKLAAFHAGFTWLTLRAFRTHFVCLATAASALVAVLPLVPVALVALPAVFELVLLRGAPVQGLALAALHLGAYYFGDDLIFREIEPTLPYLVGLGVFGGMYTFSSPLQGVLLGPMLLALLSVGYNLHREMY